MSRELLNKEIGKYEKALQNNEITAEQLMQDLRDVCFAEPKVDAKEFLDVVHQYDKNFAPIPEGAEVQKRTEIMKKAQEGVLKQAMHESVDTSGLKLPDGQDQIARHHRIPLRDGTQAQKQEMLDLLTSGDKKAVGEYIYNRLGAHKEELLSLLDMNDEQLVENYFRYADDISLIAELQKWNDECEYTPEQARDMQELFDNMGRFAGLPLRVDLVANPYYAKYPIESMKVPEDNLLEFDGMMANLAVGAGERVNNTAEEEYLSGPTQMLGRDYYGVRIFMSSAASKQIEDYMVPFGKKPTEFLWADPKGTQLTYVDVPGNLLEGKLVFASIPGVGAKAFYNTATNPLDFKLEEAPNAVINRYMQTASQNAREQVEKANPFFLSVFSGSKEFNALEKYMKEAEKTQKALEGMTYPLDREDPRVQKAVEAIVALGKAHEAYMQRKEGQGLERDGKGRLIGRTENEVKRLAAADKAEDMYKSLKFQMEYQLSPESTHGRMQKDAADLKAKRAAEDARIRNEAPKSKTVATEVINPLTEAEKSKSTKQEMLDKSVYATMPPCKGSNAGEALGQLQKDVAGSVNMLAARAGANKEMSTSVQNDMRVHMAKLVLFDYVLRERAANNADPTAENLVAGPLEQSLNQSKGATTEAINKLAKSDAFKEAIGKVTPARMEAFLNNKESRSKDFDKVVQSALSPAKANANVMGDQAAQVTNVLEQPKAELQPEPPKPAVPGI